MNDYQPGGPSRAELDARPGAVVVDFGTNWCGYCNAARPLVDAALATATGVAHLRIEDGPGRPTGRSFGVKLWPTLVFLANGREVARLVRPSDADALREALAALSG